MSYQPKPLMRSGDLIQEGYVTHRASINKLINRGKFPKPDCVIGGTNIWRRTSLEAYFFGTEGAKNDAA